MNKELLLDPKDFKVDDLKKLAETEKITLPSNVKTKNDIAKYIYDEFAKRELQENETKQETTEGTAVGVDLSNQPDMTVKENIIIRTDSSGIHRYDRDTHTATFQPHEVL